MSFIQKLKNINRKWIYITAAILVVLIVGCFAIRGFHRGFEMRQQKYQIENYTPLYQDILSLENSASLKITPDQAKSLLPIVEKLNTTDKTVKAALSKQAYALLTPQQYQALSNGGRNLGPMEPGNGFQKSPNSSKEREKGMGGDRGKGRMDNQRFGHGFSNGYNNAREQALPDVVMKLLKTRSQETPKQ